MPSQILINVRPNQTRVAYLEEGILSDLKIERRTSPTLVGSVYKGKVIRVLPGMQAAFVDIGLDRAAFLYVGDVRPDIDSHTPFIDEPDDLGTDDSPKLEEDREKRALIQDLLREGQFIMVQVAKDPLGTKGARITTHVSLPGRHIVYLPALKHFGVSRKIISEEERERLRCLVENINPTGGVIIRTAGEGATEDSIRSDIAYLERLWTELEKNYKKQKNAGMIHSEMDVELRALRDLLKEEVEKVIVDDPVVFKKVSQFVAQLMPRYKKTLELYTDPSPLFDMYDLDLEISRSLERKIWLKSGGYIVIDEAEALVVIDVNTGRYVGKKDLEDTIVKTNLEAIKELTVQLKVRNCGGIIIIDFIDMEKDVHKEKVMTLLEQELQRDLAKTSIVTMSELGLVEMTRKRTRPSLVSTLCEPCNYCDGNGYLKRLTTIASEILLSLEREAARSSAKRNLQVECRAEIADHIYAEESEYLERIENLIKGSVSFNSQPQFHIEQFEVAPQSKKKIDN